jgi:hypothetical protein
MPTAIWWSSAPQGPAPEIKQQKGATHMNDLERFQALQRLLVDAGFATTLEARREKNEAVFSLSIDLCKQTPEEMAVLAEITTKNNFAFTVDDDRADISLLET